MMKYLLWTLPVLLLFRIEIFHFLTKFTLIQWTLLLSISTLCLFVFREKVKAFVRTISRKIKYFNLKKYRRKLSKWARQNDPEVMGKSLVSQLERNVFTKLGCILFSTVIFSHYPQLLTNPTLATNFLIILTIYPLIGLAFRKDTLIFMVGIYVLIAFMPYATAFLSHDTGINLFETFPTDIVYFLDIDVSNLTQTANKLFLFTLPWYILIILFFIVSSVIIKSFLKLIFTTLLKILQSLNPA